MSTIIMVYAVTRLGVKRVSGRQRGEKGNQRHIETVDELALSLGRRASAFGGVCL